MAVTFEGDNRLALVLDSADAGMYDWNLTTGTVERTSYYHRFLGLVSSQVQDDIGFWRDRVHPDDFAHVNKLVAAAIAAPATRLSAEYRMRHNDGTWRWIRDTGQVADVDAVGRATRFVGFVSDITERRILEREIIEIANREQQRIGSDLHDGLGQDLTGIALMLGGIAAQLRNEGSRLHFDVEDVVGLVNSAIESTRQIARGLTPVSAGEGGLPAALRALAEKVDARYGVSVTLELKLQAPVELEEAAATHAYRIVQEAVTNAVRHSGARAIAIVMQTDDGHLSIRVTDDGRGFNPDSAHSDAGGLGLRIMRYRARLLGGDLQIESLPGLGTSIDCWYPICR